MGDLDDGLDQIRKELNELDQKFHEDDNRIEENKDVEMPLDEQSILSTFDGKIDKKRDVDITKSHQYKIMYTSSRDVVDKIKSKAEKAPEKERDGDSYKSYHSDS